MTVASALRLAAWLVMQCARMARAGSSGHRRTDNEQRQVDGPPVIAGLSLAMAAGMAKSLAHGGQIASPKAPGTRKTPGSGPGEGGGSGVSFQRLCPGTIASGSAKENYLNVWVP